MSYEIDGDPWLSNQDVHVLIRKFMKDIDTINNSEISNQMLGDSYYNDLTKMGVAGFNQSIGTPTHNTINRYYDEKRNYSILAPTLDPTSIVDISKRAREYIKSNDWSESYFFTSSFDKDEVEERWLEKHVNYTKRLEWLRIKDIKRKKPLFQLIGINLLLLDKLDNILRYATKNYILEKVERRPKGKNFYLKNTFTNGSAATRIDFTDLSKCKNADGLQMRNFPSTEMFSIIVRCDTGGPIQIALNEDDNITTYIDLSAGEEHKVDSTDPIVKSVNIRANGADATVRVFGLF